MYVVIGHRTHIDNSDSFAEVFISCQNIRIIIIIIIIINIIIIIIIIIIILGVFAKECSSFLEMLDDLDFQKQHQNYCIRRMTTIAIRATYYIFCCRNKEWMNPELFTF